jgi:hypothetical protein
MIQNHFLSITNNTSKELVQHNTPWFTTTGSVNTPWFTTTCSLSSLTIIHNHWLSIIHHDSQPLASGCESWCVMLSQRLWIMVWYAEQVVVNHFEWWWASGCESWCVMLSQWLWIMVSYDEPVMVNHGVLWWDSGCESWCTMHSQPLVHNNTPWFTTTGSA